MKRVIQSPGAAPTLFPDADLDRLLAYVRHVWDELRRIGPAWWNQKRETKLVEGFHIALNNDDRLMQHGVGFGHLTLEAIYVELDPNGIPRHRGRTDIRFSHASNMGPTLVFEFKRLDNKHPLRTKYAFDGVERFVNGKYSPETDLAVMVGLVKGAAPLEKQHLIRFLNRATTIARLKSKAMNFPAHGDPSLNDPSLDFDTLHDRTANCSAPEIRVGHMLLER